MHRSPWFGRRGITVAVVTGLILAACSVASVDEPQHITATSTSRYESFVAPLTARSNSPVAGIDAITSPDFRMHTGGYEISFDGGKLLVTRPEQKVGLALQPLGPEVDLLASVDMLAPVDDVDRVGVVLSGTSDWAEFSIHLSVFPYNPGLLHYEVIVTPHGEFPSTSTMPEWKFVDRDTGVVTSGGYEPYAERAAGAAPSVFGYSEALDSTILYWVDLTALNPFIETTGASTVGTPQRRGQHFGHNVSGASLRRLHPGEPTVLYSSYLYLAPGSPPDETTMFRRYLTQVSDIYDLLLRHIDPLPDWRYLAAQTFVALDDPDTWIELDGHRYWRAYVADTRQTVEAITQLDVGLAAARYIDRYGDAPLATMVATETVTGLPHFYNPAFGLIQNDGPLSVTGDQGRGNFQGRGNTWYELGHVLKATEWGLLGYQGPADLALRSRAAWIEFAETVNYRFPQFYSFATWKGTGRQPDAAGGYALYMLRLVDLGCGDECLNQAKAAVRAYEGYGFGFAYETHMTAAAALAAAELAERTGDDDWLEYAYGPIANLIRLSWIHEVDYGPAGEARTFFGLAPTQRAATFTPKEQYEAWIYLTEFLRVSHGRLNADVEKLVAEFLYHTLVTLAFSMPPLLPEGVATEHPSAYPPVGVNRLDLYIPLEDMRDNRTIWGAIGQQVYGAGMAPTFAALAYHEPAPGITFYSGYPPMETSQVGREVHVVWAGAAGYRSPVMAWGVTNVTLDGSEVPSVACGDALCFNIEGGRTYVLGMS